MAEITFEHSDKYAIIRATGTLTYDEIAATAKQYGSQITRDLVWDCSATDAIRIDSKQIQSFPEIVREYMVNREPGGKTALVGFKDHIFGVFNMYSSYADISKLPYFVCAFRTLEEANKWIRSARTLAGT